MKRKIKSGSGIWQYLESTGLLEIGTPEQLEAARKQYWKEYRCKWKQSKRTTYSVSLTIAESKELTQAAKAHHTAPTPFIKQAAFAYINTKFVVPDAEAVQEIRLLLAKNYLALQTILEDSAAQFDTPCLMQHMAELEQEVLHRLLQPDPLDVHVAKLVAGNPALKEHLLSVLQSGEL